MTLYFPFRNIFFLKYSTNPSLSLAISSHLLYSTSLRLSSRFTTGLSLRITPRNDSLMVLLGMAIALNEQCMSEATRAFGDVHPVVARAMDQKGQFLLARRDLDGAAAWFAEARKVRTIARVDPLCLLCRKFSVARCISGRVFDCCDLCDNGVE